MGTKLPEASFISMVDAVFCTVSIIMILMVMIPQNMTRVGQIAQADLTISCAMRDALDYTIQTRKSGDSRSLPAELAVNGDTEFPAAVAAARRFITGELARLDQLSARVGVVFAGRDRVCVDTIVCALARRVDECLRSDVEIPEQSFGIAMPIVTIVYSGGGLGER